MVFASKVYTGERSYLACAVSIGIFISKHRKLFVRQDLALINRAGGLYGRILTEVVSTDRPQ